MIRAALALLALTLPAAGQSSRYSPEQKPQLLKEFAQQLLRRGWNCDRATDFTIEEPDHYGDVVKVICEATTLKGETRTLAFRMTYPKRRPTEQVRVEPWK